MNERIQQLLAEIQRIQKERQANWPTPDGPTNEETESEHIRRILKCREEINKINLH
jgi:hypothetical protein